MTNQSGGKVMLSCGGTVSLMALSSWRLMKGAKKGEPKGEYLCQEWSRKGGLPSCFSQEDTERQRNSIALLAECDREGEGLEADRENEKERRRGALSCMILSDWKNRGTRSKGGLGRRNRKKKKRDDAERAETMVGLMLIWGFGKAQREPQERVSRKRVLTVGATPCRVVTVAQDLASTFCEVIQIPLVQRSNGTFG